MPVVGWVVHGHFWTLHVSYREIDGSIVCSPSAQSFIHSLTFVLIEGLRPLPLREHCDIPWLVPPPSNSRGSQALGETDVFSVLIGQAFAMAMTVLFTVYKWDVRKELHIKV